MTPQERERLIEAFTRGDDYIEDLADALYVMKVRVYEDTLAETADLLGYDVEDVRVSDAVDEALSDEADQRAELIAGSFNKSMSEQVAHLAEESYEDAVTMLSAWADGDDERRSQVIGITEAFGPHADATMSVFADNAIEATFSFGHQAPDEPAQCPICQAIEAGNPHSLERVLAIGSPHVQCRQSWHPEFDAEGLPDELDLGLRGVVGIVGSSTLSHREGGRQGAVNFVEAAE